MISIALMLAQVEAPPVPVRPVPATIAAVRANPRKFDGQVVRLTGWMNGCTPRSCFIDERPATAAGGAGQSLSIGGDPKFDATIKPLLPTYVEFDARFSAECVIGPCADRAPVLTIITLRSVVSPAPPETEN